MTNTVALWIGIVLVATLAGDFALAGGQLTLTLSRQLVLFVEWLAFWR
ncbi:hypothetical protein HKCCE3408_18465 [Rhodobacterales bacterium HKCCE3408]|nr:hypothetical protein [Rhodobacterales bacterium HKCCE3408]